MSIVILPPERRTPEAMRQALWDVLQEYVKLHGRGGHTAANPIPEVVRAAEDTFYGWRVGGGDLR